MSNINNQQQQSIAPPQFLSGRGGVLGPNQYSYQNRPNHDNYRDRTNQYNYRPSWDNQRYYYGANRNYSNSSYRRYPSPSPYYYRQNTYYNRNYQQQQQEIKHRSFHFYYLYEWGPRRQFNKEFQRLWSHYINAYPMLPKDLGQIHLTTRYLHSLNTLLAQEKKPSEISSKKKK